MNKLVVLEENAPKFSEWLKKRGGLAVWRSVDLSDPGASCTTPALTEDGKAYPQPHWKYDNKPERIVIDANEVQVQRMVEVKRFHVATKRGNSFNYVLTDGAQRRLYRELEKAGSTYIFDYGAYENCIILKPDKVQTLTEWEAKQAL
jgi:hypothetical protein